MRARTRLIAELHGALEPKSAPPAEDAEDERRSVRGAGLRAADRFRSTATRRPRGAAPAATNITSLQAEARALHKGNETTRLMRELARLGSLTVNATSAEVPLLADLDPEAAYLSWRVALTADQDIDAVQAVFEFVDGDCQLDIDLDGRRRPAQVEPVRRARKPRRPPVVVAAPSPRRDGAGAAAEPSRRPSPRRRAQGRARGRQGREGRRRRRTPIRSRARSASISTASIG